MDGEKMDWEIQRGEYIEQLQTENQRLREALEFYADPENWEEDYGPEPHCQKYSMILDDQGHTARNALQKEG